VNEGEDKATKSNPLWWRLASAEAITFLVKDVVLLAVPFYLLKQDLVRETIRTSVFAEQEAVVR
jgi:hypothetical protein